MAEAFNFYDAPDADLERFLLFSVAVAGKTADTTWKAVNRFLDFVGKPTPYDCIRDAVDHDALEMSLRVARIGKYGLLTRAYTHLILAPIDPRTVTLPELEKVPGIGQKTSRMFICYTRKDQQYAILDTHILKWLRGLGYLAPFETPKRSAYQFWEEVFLKEAKRLGKNPVDLDYEIWLSYSRKGNGDQSQTHIVR